MQKFYHGTQKMFDKFDLSHAKEGTGLKFGFGVYVTEKYESAAHYCLVRGEAVDNDRPYYVYTLEVPDQTEDNYLFSCRQVNPAIIAKAEKKFGEAIPQEVSALGKTFRKYIGNKITGKEGSVKKLCGSADFEAEKAAAEFLLGIGVVMLVWPQSQANPDGLQNRAILDGALVKVRKIERISLDEKAKLISGSEQVVKEF